MQSYIVIVTDHKSGITHCRAEWECNAPNVRETYAIAAEAAAALIRLIGHIDVSMYIEVGVAE